MDELEKLVQALNKNELILYLEGVNEYKIDLHHWIGARFPTDVSIVLSKGIYLIYEKYPSLKIKQQFEESLLDMMHNEVFDLYIATKYVFGQMLNEKNIKIHFFN